MRKTRSFRGDKETGDPGVGMIGSDLMRLPEQFGIEPSRAEPSRAQTPRDFDAIDGK